MLSLSMTLNPEFPAGFAKWDNIALPEFLILGAARQSILLLMIHVQVVRTIQVAPIIQATQVTLASLSIQITQVPIGMKSMSAVA